jgi:UDP-glucose 4-epimerase
VADVVEALAALIDCPAAVGQVLNVGNDESVTIDALADLVIELTGSSAGKRYVPYAEAYGRPIDDLLVRRPDLTRARELIGYRPRHTLRQTLEEAIAWQREGR